MKIKYLIYFLCILFLFSCDDNDIKQENAAAFPVSGEWYVHEYYGDGSDYGPYHLQVFNTSFSKDSVWISNIYDDGVMVKSLVNSDKTFDVTDAVDYSGGYGKATISNTKIIETDSIYFDVVLYNTDNEIESEFYIAGHRWTGLE